MKTHSSKQEREYDILKELSNYKIVVKEFKGLEFYTLEKKHK